MLPELPYGLRFSDATLNRRFIRTVIIDQIAISELDGTSLTEVPDFFMRFIRERKIKVTTPINLDDVKISQQDQWMQLYVEEAETDDAYLKRLRAEATHLVKKHEAKLLREEESKKVNESVKELYANGKHG